MTSWIDSNGQSWDINIGGDALAKMQKNPNFKFCWISDNPGIDNENDPKFYHELTSGDEKRQKFNKTITVKCADGSTMTGKITHWVHGKSYNCDLINWFILYKD